MPMSLKIIQKKLGSFLKLRCMISIFGEENEVWSDEFTVNDLALMRFKLYTKDSESALVTFINVIKPETAKSDKVKLKISCHDFDEPFYSEWMLPDNVVRKAIGHKLLCDVSLNEVRTCFLEIVISAIKVQDCLLVKLYNDVDFTDFHLSAENGSVAVHRAHMAACSDVFRAMLSKEWKETAEGKIQIKGITLPTLQHLKQYMYLGTLPEEGLESLLLVASYYLIDDLKAECISTLAQTAKQENWFSLFEFATENNIPELVCAITLVNPESTLQGIQNIQINAKKLDN